MENLSKEKQIEEMAKAVNERINKSTTMTKVYEALYDAGYRKQSEPFSCGHENGSEWISVEERLPEKEDDYLVYTTAGFIETDRFSVPEDKDVDGHWFELDDYVTHWMPLPEAPKMKGGEADA